MSFMLGLIFACWAGTAAFTALYVFRQVTATGRVARARIAVQPGEARPTPPSALRTRGARVAVLDLLPFGRRSRDRTELKLARAGLHLRGSEYTALRLLFAVLWALVGLTVGVAVLRLPSVLSLLPAAGLGFAGWGAPTLYVDRLQTRRLKQVERQLPDVLTSIAKSVRAGSGLLQALAYTAGDTAAPLGPELTTTLRDLQLGADPDRVFEELSARVGSADLDMAITAIQIQRSVGGNLSENLDSVTRTVRDRLKIQREIDVMTSRQRFTGNLLAAIPVLVAVAFIALKPDIGGQLIHSGAGQITLGAALLLELLGLVVVRRLAVIEY